MKRYFIKVNQNQYEVEVVEVKQNTSREIQMPTTASKVQPTVATKEIKSPQNGKKVIAPMPGNVISILVSPGDQVKKEQKLLVFESMKMQNDLTSPCDGVIIEVNTSAGAVMATGQILLSIG